MQANDKIRFATLLTGIADYYGKSLASGVIELYWQGLQQYELQAVEKALWEHTQNPDNGQFMPKIADVTRNLQGRTTDQAAIAWSKVDCAVQRIGTYSDVAFDDPLIHRVIADMGGWIKFGAMTYEDWPFISNQFRTRYQGYKMRGEIPEYQQMLIGIANAQNRVEGFRSQAPMLVGNPARARQVMLAGTTAPLIQMRRASDAITESVFKRIEAA